MMSDISLIVPTYNEKENIAILVEKTFTAAKKAKLDLEIIIVDDNSPDGTAKRTEELAKKWPIRVICRKTERGLSSAVIKGFEQASGRILGVMDADLSHPPEKIPEMIQALNNADIAIGSRLIQGGGVEEWPLVRKLISQGATLLARPITNISDPMSGFFFLKQEVIEGVKLDPIGYKILLEILAKGRYKRVIETPYVFHNRRVGTSKLNTRIQLQYLKHLTRLYSHRLQRLFKK
ncbi:MAG: polyprenol monophosphomannose synthase [Candidatus Altiarchaeota archaeon]|nr:polyprenol monophosphomannose synthase [Candidatus Altiarchaeota archaeon]